jgi:hypothetical protein
MIDLTTKRRYKVYRNDKKNIDIVTRKEVGVCRYCNDFLFPNGKMVDFTRDKEAVLMSNGSVKCGPCVREDLEKTTKLMNRLKE